MRFDKIIPNLRLMPPKPKKITSNSSKLITEKNKISHQSQAKRI